MKNKFLEMQEPEFIEGWSMNSFGKNLDFEGILLYLKISIKFMELQ